MDRPLPRGDADARDAGLGGATARHGPELGPRHCDDHKRVRVSVGVAYGSDVDHVEDTLLGVAAAEDVVLDEPEPRVRFRGFGDSALDVELLRWIPAPVLRGRGTHRLTDDGDARGFAREQGVPVVGSVGVLLAAIDAGRTDEPTADEWLSTWIDEAGYCVPYRDISAYR